jgi:hypothetical protein
MEEEASCRILEKNLLERGRFEGEMPVEMYD